MINKKICSKAMIIMFISMMISCVINPKYDVATLKMDHNLDLNTNFQNIGYTAVKLTRTPIGHLILDAMVNDVSTKLILDTGAVGTTFDITRAEKFNAELTDSDKVATGIGGDVSIKHSVINNITISDFSLNSLTVAFLDMGHVINLFAGMGIDIDGVIGEDILLNNNAVIDYNNLILYINKSKKPVLRNHELTMYVKSKDYIPIPVSRMPLGLKYIDVLVNDVSGRFILDTGASSTVMEITHAEKYGLETVRSDIQSNSNLGVGNETNATGISFATINKFSLSDVYSLRNISVPLISLAHVNRRLMAEGQEEISGIIGAEIFSGGEAIIDYQNMMLYLKRPKINITAELVQLLASKGFSHISFSQMPMVGLISLKISINGVMGDFSISNETENTTINTKSLEKFELTEKSTHVSFNFTDTFLISDADITISDIPSNTTLAAIGMPGFDGVIGSDILSKGEAIIDFGNTNLYLNENQSDLSNLSEFLKDFGYIEVSFFTLPSGMMYLYPTINGVKGKFAVSINSNRSLIDSNQYAKFGLEAIELAGATLAGGSSIRYSEVKKLSINDHFSNEHTSLFIADFAQMTTLSTDDDINGILGLDFLVKNSTIIDLKNKKMYFRL